MLKTTAKRLQKTKYIRLEMLLNTRTDLHDLYKTNLQLSELMFRVQYHHRKKKHLKLGANLTVTLMIALPIALK